MAEREKSKKGMPSGMYIGSAWIGFSVLMLLCWVLAFFQTNSYLQQGIGNVANFMLILNLIAIFGFALPMAVGIRTLRRAGRQVRERERDEQATER